MSADPRFPWPRTPGSDADPHWTGHGFEVGGRPVPFLHYQKDASSWEPELLSLHETQAGEDHFIDIASRRQALDGLRFASTRKGVVMEVGMSSGYLLPRLREAYPEGLVIGADLQPDVPTKFIAQDDSFPLLQFDVTRCPLPDACLDVAVLLNVLEHIKDDQKALAEVARVLKPGGIMILEVPAGPGLYDVYDAMLNHYRRYSMKGLIGAARSVGLQPLWRSHLGFLLYPGFAAVKLMNRWRFRGEPASKARERVAKQIASNKHHPFFTFLMRVERRLSRIFYLPFGIRCLLVARKPGPWQRH